MASFQHRLRFLQRRCMIQFRRHRNSVPLQDFANQEEILFLISHQQQGQVCGRERDLCGSGHGG